MGYSNEKTGNICQDGILKEDDYIDFFLKCDRASQNLKNGTNIRKLFRNYSNELNKQINNFGLLPDYVYGIDSSHIEQPLDYNTGTIMKFMSELMMISTLSEVEINMAKFLELEKKYLSTNILNPAELIKTYKNNTYNFWFNGANLTPKNINDDSLRNPKNGFKVSVRDALKKPTSFIFNNNKSFKIDKSKNVLDKNGLNSQNYRLIDALYDIFEQMHIDGSFESNIKNFKFEKKSINLPNSAIYKRNKLYLLKCPNIYSCNNSNFKEFLFNNLDHEIFCSSCGSLICELDTIGLTDEFQSEMSNINLLSDLTYLFEHIRCVQRINSLVNNSNGKHNIALIMDGTLGLFRKLQLLTPGIKSIIEKKLNNGSTVFGVVKHSQTKDFFDYLDDPRNMVNSQIIPNGSFWIVRNQERYKYITPRFNNNQIHGQYTHYGIDVMVKTMKGYRFLISVAVPENVQKKALENKDFSKFEQDIIIDYIQDNYYKLPFFMKMLASLEKVQMLLYGGSTIPQTLTHSQASISWNVSGRVLSQAISKARKNK